MELLYLAWNKYLAGVDSSRKITKKRALELVKEIEQLHWFVSRDKEISLLNLLQKKELSEVY